MGCEGVCGETDYLCRQTSAVARVSSSEDDVSDVHHTLERQTGRRVWETLRLPFHRQGSHPGGTSLAPRVVTVQDLLLGDCLKRRLRGFHHNVSFPSGLDTLTPLSLQGDCKTRTVWRNLYVLKHLVWQLSFSPSDLSSFVLLSCHNPM